MYTCTQQITPYPKQTSPIYTVHLSTLQTRKYAWKDVGMVATRYCKGIAVLIVACLVGFRGSVDLFGVVHPYMNDLCIFCESAFFFLLLVVFTMMVDNRFWLPLHHHRSY